MGFEKTYLQFDEKIGEFIKNVENYKHNNLLHLSARHFIREILNFQAELQQLSDVIIKSLTSDISTERNQINAILKEIYDYVSPLKDEAPVFQNERTAKEIFGKMPWLRQHCMRLHSAVKKAGLIK